MTYAPQDLTPEEAVDKLDDLHEVLTWAESWLCGRDDDMAEHINTQTRDDISHVINRLEELEKE